MFIQTESTPNPRTLKFLPGRDVLGLGEPRFSADAHAGARVAAGGRRCSRSMASSASISAAISSPSPRAEAIEWPHLKPHVLAAIMDHFTTGRPVLAEA